MISPDIELETRHCPLECPPNDELVMIGRDRAHGLPGTFRVVKCASCGLMRTNPRPTLETIGSFYPDSYGPYQSTRVKENEPWPLWKRLIAQTLQLNIERLPSLRPGRLLEFGCGSGAFLHRMATRKWQVEGLELSASAANLAQALGFHVHIGPVELAPEPVHPYDLVVGWMVLEHLHDPVAVLRRFKRWTRPGGWLVISVPNLASLEVALFKEAWWAWELPRHLYHFTPLTIQKTLQAGGWQMERLFHQRVLGTFVASLGYVLQDHNYPDGIVRALIKYPEIGPLQYFFYPLGFTGGMFGQTGRMTIWARNL